MSGACPAAIGAFFLFSFAVRMLNISVFPLFEPVLPYARDICSGASVVMYVVVVLVVQRAPKVLWGKGLAVCSSASLTCGFVLMFVGLAEGSSGALLVGSSLYTVGTVWFFLIAKEMCTELSFTQAVVGLSAAVAAAQGSAFFLQTCSLAMQVAALGLSVFLLIAVTWKRGLVYAGAAQNYPALSDAAILSPASYLSLGSKIFVCMGVFSVIGGFNLRFGPVEGSVAGLPWGFVSLVVVAICGLAIQNGRALDAIFNIAVVTAIAGFLFIAPHRGCDALVTGLFVVSYSLSDMLFMLAMVAAVRRNPRAGLMVFAWGNALGTSCTILGANLGAVAGADASGQTSLLIAAAMATAFIAFIQFGMRRFSFFEAIMGIEPDNLPKAPAVPDGESAIHGACMLLMKEKGLTPREVDVVEMLAKGRNNARIQEELTLTRSTVKTYINRVYTKLGVHSQQELIDVVEAKCGTA